MTTPVWSILQTAVLPQSGEHTNVVQSVKWQVLLSDGVNYVVKSGETVLAPPINGFTPYEALTEAQVVAWVKEALGVDTVTAIETGLQAELTAISSPSIVYPPLPWK